MKILDTQVAQKLSLMIVMCGSIMMLFISYLLLSPQNPIDVVQPYRVLSSSVVQGERLDYEVEYCLDKDLSFLVDRRLLNLDSGEIWDIPDRFNIMPKGCTKEVHGFLVSRMLEPGRYKMLAYVSIEVNPLRRVPYNLESDIFNVRAIE